MGESAAATAAAHGDGPDGAKTGRSVVVQVADEGDIVLDVTFETSIETLRISHKAALAAARKAGSQAASLPVFKSKVKVAYRVSLEALKKHSKYFENLLSNSQFREATLIETAHRELAARQLKPSQADAEDLPWITITDDDEATKAARREHAFEDILRIIHQKPPKATRVVMSEVTTMAIIADRFDCVSAVARSLNSDLKFKWPVTGTRPLLDDSGRATSAEQTLREKILVSWLLGQPMRLHQASRELITRGSSLWSAFHDGNSELTAAWWNLPEGLEGSQFPFPGASSESNMLVYYVSN